MSFEELQHEAESLSREDEKTRQMLGNLKRIDAPKDFDFRLKARLANAQASDFHRIRLFPILRYVAPLSLTIVVLGILVFNGLFSFDNQTVPSVAENFSQKQNEKGNLPTGDLLSEQTLEIQSNVQKAAVENSVTNENSPLSKKVELAARSEKRKTEKQIVENNEIYSKNSALSSRPVYFPKGLNTNKIVDKPKDFDNPTSFSVKDVLSPIGVEMIYSDNKWKVVSVKTNSLAERSGVKTNDVIEAIDGNQLSNETIFTKAFSGKSLNIIRDGERREIKLQNK